MSKTQKSMYFSHDFDARNDVKIQALLAEHGAFGYGVYWSLIEMMHQEESGKIPFKPYVFIALAKQMLADAKQIEALVKQIVAEYELFQSDENYFWSERVLRNKTQAKAVSEAKKEAGKKGGISKAYKQNVAGAKQNVAGAKQNVAKEKEKEKEKENIINPPNPPYEKFDAENIELPEFIDRTLWVEHVRICIEAKKPMGETAVHAKLRKLIKLNHENKNVNRILEYSNENGYLGIIDPDERRQTQPEQPKKEPTKYVLLTPEMRAEAERKEREEWENRQRGAI